MGQANINSLLLAVFGILVTAGIAYFVRMNAKMNAQDVEIATLKTQISPLWAQVQAKIAADLHHPHQRYFEMDGLLEKLEALTISHPERVRLKVLLTQRSKDMHPNITNDQRSKAALMIQVMDLVLVEAKEKEEGASQDAGLQELAKQTLRNVDKAKVAATIVLEQVEQQNIDSETVAKKAGEHFDNLLKAKEDANKEK